MSTRRLCVLSNTKLYHRNHCTETVNALIDTQLFFYRADRITVETYTCTTRENNWNPVFHKNGQKLKTKLFIFDYFRGPGGAEPSMIRLGLSCFPDIHSPIFKYIYMWNKEAIWQELFKFKFKFKIDDSAFFRTQIHITDIYYFEYLPSLLFGWQKPFSPHSQAARQLYPAWKVKVFFSMDYISLGPIECISGG